jgi:uncharacterized protein (TIGR02996 family)
MTDRLALIRAIIENPDDDAPRLIYADWLDEHGDPERAELIRLECERENMILGTKSANERYSPIGIRCGALLKANYRRWIEELGPLPPNRQLHFWFRRGMAAEVTCTAKYFLEHGALLFNMAPIEQVQFHQLKPAHVRALANCPWREKVRELSFRHMNRIPECISALLSNWPFPRLKAWNLSSYIIDRTTNTWHNRCSEVAEAIADSACLHSLRRLSLAGCGVGDAGGRAIARSQHLGQLIVLDLKDNPMSPSVRRLLRTRFGRGVFFDYKDHKGWRARDLI